MPEALKMIKEDLGPLAIIISTRKVKKGGGAFGMFGKPMLEITAARDEKTKAIKPAEYNGLINKHQQSTYEKEIADNPPKTPRRLEKRNDNAGLESLKGEISELKDLVSELRRGYRRDTNDEASIKHLRYDLSELKGVINTLVAQSDQLREEDLHENLIALYQQLCFNGVEDKFARKLINEVKRRIPKREINNFSYVKIYVARMFMQVLKIDPAPTLKSNRNHQKILTFLGPTGVGKTTTIAKIAGNEKFEHPDIKMGFVTLDTFRIGGVQQLQEYARIINVPIRVASDRKQLDHTLEEFQKKDLVFIDSAGRSQRDELQMSELRDILRPYSEFNNLLVLSSTTKDNDLVEITKRFGTIPLKGIVFTKLDESTSYGSIFNHAIRFKLPLTYLTTGQNVPDDIENASRDRLIDLLLNISGMES